jgi:hypothetical protein
LLVPQIDLALSSRDVLGRQMLTGVVTCSQPRVDERLLNVNRPRLHMLVIAGSRGHGIRLLPLGFLLLDLLLDRLTLAIFLLLLLVPLLGQFLLLLGLLLHFELLLQLKLPLSFFVPFLFFKQSVANLFGQVEIDSVVFDKASQSLSAIVDLAKLDEQRDQVIQLAVLGVIIP